MFDTRKLLLMTAGLLCCSLFGFLFVAYPVFAHDIEHQGGVTGGRSESIPFDIKVGEMIQGELAIKTEPLRLSIADFTGKSIHDFGVCDSRLCFHYAAGYDGQHYLVISNPNADSVGASVYDVDADIVTTGLQPGAGSGVNVTDDVTGSSTPPVWTIVIIGVLIGVIVAMFVKRRRRPSDKHTTF